MAKSKRNVSAAQRDKTNIARAKYLKKVGILSKLTKLHGGKYISKAVLRKVRQLEAAADYGYKPVKVSKELASAAKAKGFQVVQGNKIIGPPSYKFRKRLKEGQLTGVRPVKGGMLEEVILPHTITDIQKFLNNADDIDNLKLDDEVFAFKYKGFMSYRAFVSTKDMLEYLRYYQGLFNPESEDEEFENFVLLRLHGEDQRQFILSANKRPYLNNGRNSHYKSKAGATGYIADKRREKWRKRDLEKREEIYKDPAKLEEYRKRKREQAALRRAKKKEQKNGN